mgnify:CR=1 FL=1
MVTLVNRVKQNITSTGTGLNVTLGTAVAGYQTLSDAGVALSEQVHYVIEDGDAWEYGIGTLFFTSTNFYRAQQKSSDGTSRIDLSGSAVMFVSPLAEDISNSYIEKTANYTAKAGEKILANTSGGAWTLTLPSSAVGGTRIVVADHDDWSTNNLTVARNGNNIEGDAEDMILDIGGALVEFVWDGAQWQIYTQIGAAGGNVVSEGDSPTFAGLTVDTDTLYVDAANNRVGIGTTSPATALDVDGVVTATSYNGDGSALTGISGTPTGTVIYHAANTAPTGFVKANGASLNTSTYADLFAVIGYTFGGSGSSFNVPDLRGEFMRGWDDSRGVDSGRVFGSFQSDDFGSHSHTAYGGFSTTWFSVYARSGSWGSERYIDTDSYQTASTGSADTRPRNIALLACIKT